MDDAADAPSLGGGRHRRPRADRGAARRSGGRRHSRGARRPCDQAARRRLERGLDELGRGRSAGEHLVGLGHRRIGIVDAGPGTLYNAARVDGFRSALTNAGLDLPTSRIVHGDWSRDAAGEAVLPVLAGADRPTALFACSESMAFGIYDAAASLGLRIPQDLSVVGFDDLPEAQWATPPMTTVQQPTAEMGSVALRILLDLIRDRRAPRGRPRGVTRIELATHFVVRGSTAPPEA
ncbi:substrate-binding domain-containing protein [Frondihabitans sp. PAMC 28766]|uniref:substrate-binding domain-containing protein n=1 Tax=Frondihabitans sp. PAMC 28766 TaxID=1795630 RepID=UPI0012FF7C92|nr:substrate-binding domain-containing protein [Frondihabitans sp. PAMC 28766]